MLSGWHPVKAHFSFIIFQLYTRTLMYMYMASCKGLFPVTFGSSQVPLLGFKGQSAAIPCDVAWTTHLDSIEWFHNNTVLQKNDSGKYDGGTIWNMTLIIYNLSDLDGGIYRCRVTRQKRVLFGSEVDLAVCSGPGEISMTTSTTIQQVTDNTIMLMTCFGYVGQSGRLQWEWRHLVDDPNSKKGTGSATTDVLLWGPFVPYIRARPTQLPASSDVRSRCQSHEISVLEHVVQEEDGTVEFRCSVFSNGSAYPEYSSDAFTGGQVGYGLAVGLPCGTVAFLMLIVTAVCLYRRQVKLKQALPLIIEGTFDQTDELFEDTFHDLADCNQCANTTALHQAEARNMTDGPDRRKQGKNVQQPVLSGRQPNVSDQDSSLEKTVPGSNRANIMSSFRNTSHRSVSFDENFTEIGTAHSPTSTPKTTPRLAHVRDLRLMMSLDDTESGDHFASQKPSRGRGCCAFSRSLLIDCVHSKLVMYFLYLCMCSDEEVSLFSSDATRTEVENQFSKYRKSRLSQISTLSFDKTPYASKSNGRHDPPMRHRSSFILQLPQAVFVSKKRPTEVMCAFSQNPCLQLEAAAYPVRFPYKGAVYSSRYGGWIERTRPVVYFIYKSLARTARYDVGCETSV